MHSSSGKDIQFDCENPSELEVIDLLKEEVQVSKRTEITGRVDITKSIKIEEVPLTLKRLDNVVEIDRRPMGTLHDNPIAAVRELADGTVVYSVVKEVPVVVMRYELVEEIHVKQMHLAQDEHIVVPIRREDIEIKRTPVSASSDLP